MPGSNPSAFRALADLGKVDLIDFDGSVAPNITSLHPPGHTPGHQTYVVSCGRERALFLGDAIACPLQMEAKELEALADFDRQLGIRTEIALWRNSTTAILSVVRTSRAFASGGSSSAKDAR